MCIVQILYRLLSTNLYFKVTSYKGGVHYSMKHFFTNIIKVLKYKMFNKMSNETQCYVHNFYATLTFLV